NFYYASLYQSASQPGLTISVHRGSFDEMGGFQWGAPTLAVSGSGEDVDKEHVGVDKRPGTNTLYVSYSNFAFSGTGQVEVVRSIDGGATFSDPVVIAPASAVVHQGSIPRVGPDGELYVVWEDGFVQIDHSLHVRKSTSWPDFGPDTLITNITAVGNPLFNSRVNEFPSMAIDLSAGVNRGHVYVVWNDGGFGGPFATGSILLSHSSDGSSWSTPVMLNDDGFPSD